MKSEEIITNLIKQRIIESLQRPTVPVQFLDKDIENFIAGKDSPDLNIERRINESS